MIGYDDRKSGKGNRPYRFIFLLLACNLPEFPCFPVYLYRIDAFCYAVEQQAPANNQKRNGCRSHRLYDDEEACD